MPVNVEQTPFKAGWWSVDLGKYRDCDSTYCFFAYDTLPPLDMNLFGDEFQWLEDLDETLSQKMELYQPPEDEQAERLRTLDRLVEASEKMGLTLPVAFLKFMGSLRLQHQIPSCTACYFDLSEKIVKSPFGDDACIIRFLNDQQDVLMWYLYVKPDGEHGVIVSPAPYDEMDFAGDVPLDHLKADTQFCGTTFESFLYRFWIENRLWFALNEDERELTPAEQTYLSHFASD